MENNRVYVGNFVFEVEEGTSTLVEFDANFSHHPYVKVPSFVVGTPVVAIKPDVFAGHSIGNLILPEFLGSLEIDFVTIDHLGELFVNAMLYDTTKLSLMGLESTTIHYNEGNAISIQHDLAGYKTSITEGLTLATAVVNIFPHDQLEFSGEGLPVLVNLGPDEEHGTIYVSTKDLFVNIREQIYIKGLDQEGNELISGEGEPVLLLTLDVYAYLLRMVYSNSVALGGDGLLYRLSISRTHIDVIDYIGDAESVVVQPALNGLRVNDITLTLHNNSKLKSLTIPQGVTSVGAETFLNKTLEEIIVPETVIQIHGYVEPSYVSTHIKVQKDSFADFKLTNIVADKVEVVGELTLNDFMQSLGVQLEKLEGLEYVDIMDDHNGVKHYVVYNLVNGKIPMMGYNVSIRSANKEQLEQGVLIMVDTGTTTSPRSIVMHMFNKLVPQVFEQLVKEALAKQSN